MQNTSLWCRNCSVEFNPEEENVRRESKLSVPDRNREPAVTSIDVKPDVSIRKEVEIKGGLAEVAEERPKDHRIQGRHTKTET